MSRKGLHLWAGIESEGLWPLPDSRTPVPSQTEGPRGKGAWSPLPAHLISSPALSAPPALTCRHLAGSEHISKLHFWLRKVRDTQHCIPKELKGRTSRPLVQKHKLQRPPGVGGESYKYDSRRKRSAQGEEMSAHCLRSCIIPLSFRRCWKGADV